MLNNVMYNIDIVALQANFNDNKLGLCKLEFIINDNEDGKPYIEPYMITYGDEDDIEYIELLDTHIQLVNLYEVLSLMTLHHIK